MLHFAGRKAPTNVFVHGFITVSGEKMSKSRGTGISPLRYLDVGMNPEWLRYYIAAKLNAKVEDVEFNPDDFVARVNSDLVGKYVNIASRASSFLGRIFDGALVDVRRLPAWKAFETRALRHRDRALPRGTRVRPRTAPARWNTPTGSTSTSTRASPGNWPRTRASATPCSRCAR